MERVTAITLTCVTARHVAVYPEHRLNDVIILHDNSTGLVTEVLKLGIVVVYIPVTTDHIHIMCTFLQLIMMSKLYIHMIWNRGISIDSRDDKGIDAQLNNNDYGVKSSIVVFILTISLYLSIPFTLNCSF